MAGFTPAAENLALEGIVGTSGTPKNRHISLHTADPGTTGASEVTGGAYTREETTWTYPPTSSQVTGSSVTCDVPSGVTITHWGLWSALTAGTFLYGGLLPASETFGSNGTYAVTPTLSASD
jgi:hypothetical protein